MSPADRHPGELAQQSTPLAATHEVAAFSGATTIVPIGPGGSRAIGNRYICGVAVPWGRKIVGSQNRGVAKS